MNRMSVWRRENPDRAYGHWLKQRYGITLDEYAQMLHKQHYVCAICGRPQKRKGIVKRLSVDHDHETGHIRGLLCMDCNSGLSKFRDDPGLLGAARIYLIRQFF